jgi:hypothetical protein
VTVESSSSEEEGDESDPSKLHVKTEPSSKKVMHQRDEAYDALILKWISDVKRQCRECHFPACVTGRPWPTDNDPIIVFENTKTGNADGRCKCLPKETCSLLSDLLSLGVFSVWLCDPVSFQNDVNGCFDAIYHFLSVHCGLEGLKRADLYNVYHHFHSKRGPSVYNRYK